MIKNISILGSTGSIGTQTLDVIRNIKCVNVLGLTTNLNIDLLEKQIYEFKPKMVAVGDEKKAEELKHRFKNRNFDIFSGIEGIIKVAVMDGIDTVVTSVVGNSGIKPTFEAIRAGKNIALANKETLVSAGELIVKEAKENNIKIIPIDSEHSAIFQCIKGNKENKINRILLTASGGPFRGKKISELEHITLKEALNHPNWSMGRKITIDSATMMNKGLEMIEAKWLFNVDINNIEVLVHPQSIIHSAVEFEDGTVIAQMGEPDMRIPIQYALTYPKRLKNNFPKINFFERNALTFEKPDFETFKCLKLACNAIKTGGTMPAVMNAANEIAVARFLKEEISFLDIPRLIEKTINAYNVKYEFTIDDLIEADTWAREYCKNIL